MITYNFGSQLRNARRKFNLSQTELAEDLAKYYPDLRISQTTISAWEQLEKPPKMEVLEQLSDYFEMPLRLWVDMQVQSMNSVEWEIITLLRDDKPSEAVSIISSLMPLIEQKDETP